MCYMCMKWNESMNFVLRPQAAPLPTLTLGPRHLASGVPVGTGVLSWGMHEDCTPQVS